MHVYTRTRWKTMAVAVTKAGHSNAQITTLSTQTHWFQLPCPLAPCPALAPLEVTAALLQFELQPPWPLEGNLDCQLDQLLQDCSLPCFALSGTSPILSMLACGSGPPQAVQKRTHGKNRRNCLMA